MNVVLLYVIKGCTNGFCGDSYNGIPGYSMIPTLLASCSLFVLCAATMKERNLPKVGRMVGENTFCIYILHLLIGRIVSSFFYSYIPWRGVLVNTIKCIVLITISALLGQVMRKIPVLKNLTKL